MIKLMVTLLGFLWFTGLPAHAMDCYRDCMDQSGCWSSRSNENVSYCSGVQARCSTQCRDSGADSNRKSYGAIAYSAKDGAYGYSHGWKSKSEAEKVALKNCRKNGKKCKKQVWFWNSCGAVATDAGGRKVAWGQSESDQGAAQQALERCRKSGGKDCELQVVHCSR